MSLPDHVAALRRARGRRRLRLGLALLALLAAAFALTLSLGRSFTPPLDVLRVLAGADVPVAAFTVGELRLPRAALSILAGMAFGLGGAAFQTLLRNPLASPDVIGISSGAGAAAVFGIVLLGWSGPAVSLLAVAGGLGVALAIWALAWRGGVAGPRLILVGIGVSAMLQSVIAWGLAQAPSWTLQEAMRWLTGSVNGATLAQSRPLLAALLLPGALLLAQARALEAMRLGDDAAAALGVRVERTRLLVVLAAVGLVSVSTAVAGPIAFVAFLSGPIAARAMGTRGSLLAPAALVGALLTLCADYAGQFLLPARYPVGVVTGALGAPYLLYLIVRAGRSGALS
ncbi:iron chelate uptake ABC transporter family permease subunit [Albimonas sp. CAU 1670]|uniref:FecCD family ABC transporter permease n=1 Tax=Albimonas sp. CAU 1670 TaxID=3032599 RepID=UPI0023DB88F1|nr:iron chelate uptake ABC transporter family permease subunit [Albimonas sp. CAU 1670]MDF2235122.1 iron chelate uptake ABC transporter family permease subunit [Albimonas sp. CAU 1670]